MKQSPAHSTLIIMTAALAALLSPACGDIVMQTWTRHVDFTDNFVADYFTYLNEFGTLNLRMKLSIKNFDFSSWSSETGVNGIWLGVGYGEVVMADSDIVICTLRYYGTASTGQFICTDRYANSNARPELDQNQNVTHIEQT